ncbi:MAG: hypothetical protein ABIJ61_02090 [bacterium]
MRVCSIIALIAILCGLGTADLSASPIQKVRVSPALTVDLGGGWFIPTEDRFDERYKHGYNGRLALTHQLRSGLQVGAQYRISTKEGYYLPGELDHTSHWLGLRLGFDFARSWDMEASLGGVLYLLWAKLDASQPQCQYDPTCTTLITTNNTESGLGWGLDFIYAYQFNEIFGVGFEAEYNHSNLDYPVGPPIDPEMDNGYLLEYYTSDNVGGFWLAPFIRLRF